MRRKPRSQTGKRCSRTSTTTSPITWCKLCILIQNLTYFFGGENFHLYGHIMSNFIFIREQMNDMEKHLELYKNEYPLKNYKE